MSRHSSPDPDLSTHHRRSGSGSHKARIFDGISFWMRHRISNGSGTHNGSDQIWMRPWAHGNRISSEVCIDVAEIIGNDDLPVWMWDERIYI